jgi:hypothetical protein
VAGSCKHGNEQPGSIKGGKFFDCLNALLRFQEKFCRVGLVIIRAMSCEWVVIIFLS